MSRELINRITRKKDGIYVSTHSSNDNVPYHSVKVDFLTNVYKQEGQKGLDREIIGMLFNYAELRGSHHSLQRYLYAFNSKYTEIQYKAFTDKINLCYNKLTEKDKKSIWLGNKTTDAKEYLLYKSDLEKQMYSKISLKCEEYDLINNIIANRKNCKSFSYYEDIINKILNVADGYNINFESYCPFDSFGSDEEAESFKMYSFSKFYKDILENNNSNIGNIMTKEISDGKYILTINEKYEFEINSWGKLADIFETVEKIIDNVQNESEKTL